MVLWRISRHRDLSGIGGLRANGRWHYLGQPVVYLSEHPAAALLEVCVHTSASDIPPDFTLLRIQGPDIPVAAIMPLDLPGDWTTDLRATRALGTEWLRSNGAVLLQIPSAIVPSTRNFLFNPLHPDADRFRVDETISYPFDVRIKQ